MATHLAALPSTEMVVTSKQRTARERILPTGLRSSPLPRSPGEGGEAEAVDRRLGPKATKRTQRAARRTTDAFSSILQRRNPILRRGCLLSPRRRANKHLGFAQVPYEDGPTTRQRCQRPLGPVRCEAPAGCGGRHVY